MPAMTGHSPTPRSEPPTLGQVLHEARVEHNPEAERPRGVPPWEKRAQWQQDLDEKMAAAVAAAERRKIAAEIRDRAARRWPPGYHRDELLAAAAAVARGTEERDDEKGTRP